MPIQRRLRTLTVVAPFYNEEANVQPFYETLSEQLIKLGVEYCLICVDDGSTDQTLGLLNAIANRDSHVTVLSLTRNFGHQYALTAGLDHSDTDAVVVMDSDLQHPAEAIVNMVRHFEAGAEVVYAVRSDNHGSGFLKQLTSNWYYAILKYVAKAPVIHGAADFRLMSRETVVALREMRETHRYLRGMVAWMGFPYAVIYYHQNTRHAGKPSYTWLKSLDLATIGLFSFSTIPLQIITWFGFVLIGIAGLYLIYVLLITVFGRPVPGWSSVIVALLVIGAIQIISLSIIAQYIGMILEQVKGRPLYLLKQKGLAAAPKLDRRRLANASRKT